MRFRIRSPLRDAMSDAGRLHSVESAILSAIANAEFERSGFQRRLEDARHRASLLVGNEAFEYLEREKETERDLCASEREFAAAGARIRELGQHIQHLQEVLRTLKRAEESATQS